MRCKLLDVIFNAMSLSVSVEFYIIFLSWIFWIDQVGLAEGSFSFFAPASRSFRHSSRAVALYLWQPLCNKPLRSVTFSTLFSSSGCIASPFSPPFNISYIGNSLKDIISTERPQGNSGCVTRSYFRFHHTFRFSLLSPTAGVERQNLGVVDEHANEFGFPSTHSLNSVCMCSYMLFHIQDVNIVVMAPLALLWCIGICYSRIYLGMHTPVDIVGGVIIGLALGAAWLSFGEYIDDAMMSHPYSIPLHLLISFVLLSCYPSPTRPTPSYKYFVYFAGVAVGGNIGILRTRSMQPPLLPPMSPQISLQFAVWSMRRFAAGIVVVVIFLFLTDKFLTTFMPRMIRLIRIPSATDKDASRCVFKTTSGSPYLVHVDTCRRFVTYGVVAWAVVEPALLLIRYFEL